MKYVYELMMKREGETKREREIDSGRQICGREPGAIEREREREILSGISGINLIYWTSLNW